MTVPQRVKELNDKGVELFGQKKFDEAIGCFNQAIEIVPAYRKAWLNKANSLLELGRDQEALNSYERAVDASPLFADAWYSKASLEKQLGREEKAVVTFQLFLTFASSQGSSFIQQAKESLGELLDKGHRRHPQEAFDWILKGYKYAAENNRIDDALKFFESAIQIDSKIAKAWQFKGIGYSQKGQKEEAVACYTKAIELDPGNAVYWYNKGGFSKTRALEGRLS